ncbi:hypothetical protein XENTR_v10022334 [Xenopus tropicalis]|nr:hypothetical protein XENTR_v10022334 [Xenopus tropicalis]
MGYSGWTRYISICLLSFYRTQSCTYMLLSNFGMRLSSVVPSVTYGKNTAHHLVHWNEMAAP